MADAQVHRLTGVPTKLGDIPRDLLEQKKIWNLGAMIHMADADPGILSLAIMESHDDHDPILVGVLVLVNSHLYKQITVDTLIVDKPIRTHALVKACFQLARELAFVMARMYGHEKVAWSTTPELVKRYFDYLDNPENMKIGEQVLHLEVPYSEEERADGQRNIGQDQRSLGADREGILEGRSEGLEEGSASG